MTYRAVWLFQHHPSGIAQPRADEDAIFTYAPAEVVTGSEAPAVSTSTTIQNFRFRAIRRFADVLNVAYLFQHWARRASCIKMCSNEREIAMYLDMRTIFLSYMISAAIGAGMLAWVWHSTRRQWGGPGWWAAGAALHFMALLLILLRGRAPDLLSIVGGNGLLMLSLLLLYEGVVRFVQQRVVQTPNLILLLVFIAVHTYFTLAQPNMAAREINLSIGLLVVCAQCIWLTLRRVAPDARSVIDAGCDFRSLGGIWIAYGLTGLARILLVIAWPPGDAFFTKSNPYDAWVMLTYQTLFILLIFSLVMLVNRRLSLGFQKQTEALRLSENKFAKAFHAMPDAIFIVRPDDGRIVEVNEGFCRMTGYSRAEAVGHSILNLSLWADPQQRAAYIAAVQTQRSVHDYEYDFIVKSGARSTCLCASEIIEMEGEPHIFTVVRDITAARQATAALRESETRLRAIGDNLPAGQIYQLMVLPDGTSRFTYISSAVEQLHECTPADALADPTLLFNRVVEEDREAMQLAMEKSIHEMSVYDHTVRIHRTSGEIRWHRHISRPRRGPEGAILFDGIDMDVTEQHTMQTQLMQQQRSTAAQAERQRLARDLHDSLTQSLHSLHLLVETAQHLLQREQHAALPALLETLRASAQQARHELRLLVYELQLPPIEDVELAELLADRLAFVEQRAGLQTHLSVHGSGYIPPAMRKPLFFIVSEALNNTLRHARASAVRVELKATPVQVTLRVSDNGCGFDEAHAAPGMGLRNLHARADELHGRLTIDSAPGAGTTIHLDISLKK